MNRSDPGFAATEEMEAGADERLLWAQLRKASTNAAYARSWLALQCRIIGGVRSGVLLGPASAPNTLSPLALWPPGSQPEPHLLSAAERLTQEPRAAVMEISRPPGDREGGPSVCTVLAQPIQKGRALWGAVLLELDPRPREEMEHALRQLVWGSAWLELRARRGEPAGGKASQLAAVLGLVAVPREHERFTPAATAFASELATRFRCSQVSIGLVAGRRTRLRALSHSARFSAKTNLNRAREAAMDEAGDQQAEILWPAPEGASPLVTRAHEELGRLAGAGALCSVPFSHGSEHCGAVTFERGSDQPFQLDELELLKAAVGLTGPLLVVQHRDDRWLGRKAVESARRLLEHLVGPGHVALKLGTAAVALLLAFFVFAKGDYRVTADSVLEARVLRAAVAPFDGYIVQAPVRAGDRVREGDLLAELEDRVLRLEEARASSQLEQLLSQRRQAKAERDAASLRILSAQIGQVSAQLAIARDQLARTRVLAPFDGIVVSGDLSESLGAPVKRGDLLFEVAPLDDYRLVVQVDERDIDEIVPGQTGSAVFSAFPGEAIGFTVEKITPISAPGEGKNTFPVETRLAELGDHLQPGMEGVGKVGIDRRRLIWIWTHEAVDWLRLGLWSWLP